MYHCTFDININIFKVPLISFEVNNFSVILLIWETYINYYMTRMSNYISDVQSRSRSRNPTTSKMNFFESIVNAFQLSTIVAKNSLNAAGFLDLLLVHYADVQKIYAFEF